MYFTLLVFCEDTSTFCTSRILFMLVSASIYVTLCHVCESKHVDSYRDIKGANLLVDVRGVVKLADFGMAKHVSISSNRVQ